MTSDEIKRTMDFILENQANAVIRIEETEKQIRKLTASTDRFQGYVKDVLKVLVPLLEIQSRRLDRLEGHS